MMKKTLVAVAALAATAAFAQVTITGRASMGVSTYSATGTGSAAADVASRTRVDDYSSRLRFAVNEDLGGGTRAFAVYEFGLAYDTGTGNGQAFTANSAAAFNGSRESHLGIGNDTAELRLGRQNVYWTQGDLSEQGSNFIGKDAFADMYTRIATVRADNTILVNFNKNLGAFNGSQIYYSINNSNEAAPAGVPTAGVQTNNPTIVGAKLNWDKGAWHGMVDYHQRKGNPSAEAAAFGANTTSFDATSWKLGLGYRYAERSIIAVHYFDMLKEYLDSATNNAAPTAASVTGASIGGWRQTGYGVTLTHNFGEGLLGYASYGFLNGVQSSTGRADLSDSATSSYTLGLRKELSKRTGIFASYGQINNGANANFSPTGGSFVSATTPAGADPTFTLVGVMHNF